MYKLLLIMAGGALGSAMRYILGGWAQQWAGVRFPVGTLLVNIAGCFAIGLLNAIFHHRALVREEYRLAILIGVLGGFTTFSSFAWETTALSHDAQFGLALANVVASTAGCLIAAWAAYRLGVWMLGAA